MFVAVGGGGLASAIAMYVGEKRPDIKGDVQTRMCATNNKKFQPLFCILYAFLGEKFRHMSVEKS